MRRIRRTRNGPTSSIKKGERLFQQRADDEVQRRHHERGGPSSSLSSPASEARTGGPSSSPPWPGRMRGGERTRGFGRLLFCVFVFAFAFCWTLLQLPHIPFFPHVRRERCWKQPQTVKHQISMADVVLAINNLQCTLNTTFMRFSAYWDALRHTPKYTNSLPKFNAVNQVLPCTNVAKERAEGLSSLQANFGCWV